MAGGREPVSAAALTSLAWAVGLLVTASILGTPYLVFGYHSPALHLVLDSVDACIAFLLAYLMLGRFLRSRRLQDLLLAHGFFLLGLTGLGMALLAGLLDADRPRTLDVWLPLTLRFVAGLMILAAALVGDRVASARLARWCRTTPWLLVAGVSAIVWSARASLPEALRESPPPSAQRPVIDGHWLLITAQALTAACFLSASVLFAIRATRDDDQVLRWLGPACALGGLARVNYVLFPSLYSDWVYTGDVLRTACYALLLVGAAREIGRYWSAQARVAVLEDRRRLARELHDGLVQELGYIRTVSHDTGDPAVRGRIIGACDRALDEARAAVDVLGHGADEPLGMVLHQAARQVAERYGGHIVVDLDDSVDAEQEQRHALVRITREAVSNALRHGKVRSVRIRLRRDGDGRHLVVQDDGRGFDSATTDKGSSYGLVSMRDRAAGLPGVLDVTSRPGAGTTVGVTW